MSVCTAEEGCDRPALARGLCGKHYARVWRAEHPGRSAAGRRRTYETTGRDAQYRRLYGIGAAEVDAQREAQGDRCALCRRPSAESYRGLHVDHDHATGRPRALLCRACNVGLGKFGDDPALLRRAADYIEWSRTP